MLTFERHIREELVKPSPAALNVVNIELLKATMRANPRYYDQSDWWTVDTSCGTTCCIAGWAYVLKNGYDVNDARAANGSAMRLRAEARHWLGLSAEQASVLFAPATEWPERFYFSDVRLTKAEQVEKACAFLDYLMAGGPVNPEEVYEDEPEDDDIDDDDEDLDDDEIILEDEEEESKGGLLAIV